MFRRRRVWFVLAAGLLLAVALHVQWLPLLGNYLIQEEPPRRADAIFVLGGDQYGDRIVRAAELAKQGFASAVYVSGPAGIFDYHESDLSIPYARKRGFLDVNFVPLPNDCKSTRDEAEKYTAEWRQKGLHTVLIVTSNFHTRRALRIFRQVDPGIEFVMVAAPTRDFNPQDWWLRRQDQKTLFTEWTKTFAYWLGL